VTVKFDKRRLKAKLGATAFTARAQRVLLRHSAVVVAFHRVDDRLKGNPISCTVDEFRRFCDFFQKHFEIVSTSEVLRRLHRGADLSGCLAITFDDGYRDNFDNAAPELEARGLPATFFVASGFIGTETQPWWDQEYGVQAHWMNWEQVRSLHQRGFEIGAHTVNHVDLGVVDAETGAREIRDSRATLERELGAPVSLFAYPYGRREQISETNRSMVREAGLACCFSCYGGLVQRGADPYRLERTPITPWHVAPGQLGFELLFR
jgi:peptidoglycan/xylan/chitin deacetylase (PgdA/CDA1 family)